MTVRGCCGLTANDNARTKAVAVRLERTALCPDGNGSAARLVKPRSWLVMGLWGRQQRCGIARRTDGCFCHLLPADGPGSPRVADGHYSLSGPCRTFRHAAREGKLFQQDFAGLGWGTALPPSLAAVGHVPFPSQQLFRLQRIIDVIGLLQLGRRLVYGCCAPLRIIHISS